MERAPSQLAPRHRHSRPGYWPYSYGYPQSNGCLELPVPNAEVVWGMGPTGTLVDVAG